MKTLSLQRVRALLRAAARRRILVIGDVMLDQFLWGHVSRISPEAPVPVVEFDRESFMPGGAANVARNLTALNAGASIVSLIGSDGSGRNLRSILSGNGVECGGLFARKGRFTTIKTRIIAHQQQVVRVDRETRQPLLEAELNRLCALIAERLDGVDAVIVGDYGKGVVTQDLMDWLRGSCRERGVWLSLDPKPTHALDLKGLSLITPNRKEAFELAGVAEGVRGLSPLSDPLLMYGSNRLLARLQPALLLITLGEQGMLLCRSGHKPFHIPTVAQEVFDVSGAGDTVIASFTLAVAAGASPLEAAIFSNHAAGVVVGKVGTATVTPEEVLASFQRELRA